MSYQKIGKKVTKIFSYFTIHKIYTISFGMYQDIQYTIYDKIQHIAKHTSISQNILVYNFSISFLQDYGA